MELWDVYDDNRQPLGKTHIRDESNKLPRGENHIVAEIWTVNSNQEILLTLRHPDKEYYPNLWENTGGSVISGESSLEGAVRELYEETGIRADRTELVCLGVYKADTAFIDLYIVKKDVEIKDLTMQEGETVCAKWVDLKDFNKMTEQGLIAQPVLDRLKLVRKSFEEFLLQ